MSVRKSSLQTVQVKKTIKRHVVRTTKTRTTSFKKEIAQYLDSNGFLSWSSKEKKYIILGTNSPKKGLVQCPVCKLGELMVIRSRTTRKRYLQSSGRSSADIKSGQSNVLILIVIVESLSLQSRINISSSIL